MGEAGVEEIQETSAFDAEVHDLRRDGEVLQSTIPMFLVVVGATDGLPRVRCMSSAMKLVRELRPGGVDDVRDRALHRGIGRAREPLPDVHTVPIAETGKVMGEGIPVIVPIPLVESAAHVLPDVKCVATPRAHHRHLAADRDHLDTSSISVGETRVLLPQGHCLDLPFRAVNGMGVVKNLLKPQMPQIKELIFARNQFAAIAPAVVV